jgi:hypothetical protein
MVDVAITSPAIEVRVTFSTATRHHFLLLYLFVASVDGLFRKE